MSTKVYLVVSEDYYGAGIRGVFSTLKAAVDWADGKSKEQKDIDYIVVEKVVDEPSVENPCVTD